MTISMHEFQEVCKLLQILEQDAMGNTQLYKDIEAIAIRMSKALIEDVKTAMLEAYKTDGKIL